MVRINTYSINSRLRKEAASNHERDTYQAVTPDRPSPPLTEGERVEKTIAVSQLPAKDYTPSIRKPKKVAKLKGRVSKQKAEEPMIFANLRAPGNYAFPSANGDSKRNASLDLKLNGTNNGTNSTHACDPAYEVEKARLASMPIKEVWKEYVSNHSQTTRNFLMERYMPLIVKIAETTKQRRGIPEEVDIEDMKSDGMVGLMDAIDAFNLEREVKFKTYAAPRILGEMLDGLRAMDWVPRLVRHRTATSEKIKNEIKVRTGREPTNEEIAAGFGIAPEDFDKIKRKGGKNNSWKINIRGDSRAVNVMTLTPQRTQKDGSVTQDSVADYAQAIDRKLNPIKELARRDIKRLITKGFSRTEQLIVSLFYYEGMTMREIGKTLDISECWVYKLHSSILARLKSRIGLEEHLREAIA